MRSAGDKLVRLAVSHAYWAEQVAYHKAKRVHASRRLGQVRAAMTRIGNGLINSEVGDA